MDPQDRQEWIHGLSLLAWISGEVLGMSGAGVLLGYWLTRILHLSALWCILPGLAGLALAVYRIYKATQALESRAPKKRERM